MAESSTATSVETIQHKTNVLEESREYLIDQFKDKPFIDSLLKALASEVQEIEDALYDVLEGRILSQAEGVQLDLIGQQTGVQRFNSSDSAYRVLLGIRNEVRNGAGTYGEIYDKLLRVTGDTNISVVTNRQRRVDVVITARCLSATSSYVDLANLFPVNTNTSIIVKGDLAGFGFDGNDSASGFRSTIQASDPLAGHFVSLAYSKEQEIRNQNSGN